MRKGKILYLRPVAKNDKEMSFLDHLEELRWHLIRAVVAILLCSILGFVFVDVFYDDIIMSPLTSEFITYKTLCNLADETGIASLCLDQVNITDLKNFNFGSQFTWHIWTSLILGLIIAFPYVCWEMWRFISPALHHGEKKVATGAVFFISLLFFLGIGFGYFLILPLSVTFFANYSITDSIQNDFTFTSYISMFTTVVLWCGVIFELPMLIYFLARIGLVSSAFLKRYRKHAIVLILILSAIITPPDIASQVIVSLPLSLLYEIGIVIARRVEKKRLALDNKSVIKT